MEEGGRGDGQGGAMDEKRRGRGSMMVEGLVELRNYTIKTKLFD